MGCSSFSDYLWGNSNLGGSQCNFRALGVKVLGRMSGEEVFGPLKSSPQLFILFQICIYKRYIITLGNALLIRSCSEIGTYFGYKSVVCGQKSQSLMNKTFPPLVLLLLVAASCHDIEFQFMYMFF